MTVKFLILVTIFVNFPTIYCSYHTRDWDDTHMVVYDDIASLDEIVYNFHKIGPVGVRVEDSNIPKLTSLSFLSHVKNLTRLFLNRIHIQSIVEGAFSELKALEQIYLDGNELTVVPNGVFNSLQTLKVLSLGENKIQSIARFALDGCVDLRHLYLRNNKLTEIDEDLFKTTKRLGIVELQGNPFGATSLKALSKLPNLTILDLQTSELSNLDFSNLPTARTLRLNFNLLTSINASFKNVTFLYMHHNNLTTLEKTIFDKSKNISEINFAFNSISTVDKEVFHGLTQLKNLSLQNNALTKLDSCTFRDLTSLQVLQLSNNKIEQLQAGIFDNLENLHTLDISHNRLTNLEHTFDSYLTLSSRLLALEQVSLNDNPWKCEQLVKIYNIFKTRGITVTQDNAYDVSNFHGIACSDKSNLKSTDCARVKVIDMKNTSENGTESSNVIIILNLLVMSVCLLIIIFLSFNYFKKCKQFWLNPMRWQELA